MGMPSPVNASTTEQVELLRRFLFERGARVTETDGHVGAALRQVGEMRAGDLGHLRIEFVKGDRCVRRALHPTYGALRA